MLILRPEIKSVKEFLKADVFNREGIDQLSGACTYGFIDTKNGYTEPHTACHSAYGYYYKTYGPGLVGLTNWSGKNTHPKWFQYVTDPEHSPWKDQLNGSTTWTNGTLFAWIVTDVTHHIKFHCSFAKSMRIWTEKPDCGTVCSYLINAGVHPGISTFVSQFLSTHGNNPEDVLAKTGCNNGWHGSFLDLNKNEGIGSLQKFLQGSYRKTPGAMNKQSLCYTGVDSIWDDPKDKVNIINYLMDTYPKCFSREESKESTVVSRFGGVAASTSASITNKQLAEACLKLQADLNIKPYGDEEIDEDR